MKQNVAFQFLCVFAAAAGLGACAPTSSGLDSAASAVDVSAELPAPTAAASMPRRDFRLGPYDAITIDVFGAPELRREARIDGAGQFNMPLIGSVRAAGLTPDEFAAELANRLRGRYVRDPQVSVNVREVVSQQVTVDGEVRRPGRFPVVGEMTLQESIASAGGLSEDARLTEVVVFRANGERRLAALFSLKDIREGRAPDPAIYTGDVVVVGTSRARRLFRDLAQVSPIFNIFTPLVYNFNGN